jgi:hypothetical protein
MFGQLVQSYEQMWTNVYAPRPRPEDERFGLFERLRAAVSAFPLVAGTSVHSSSG